MKTENLDLVIFEKQMQGASCHINMLINAYNDTQQATTIIIAEKNNCEYLMVFKFQDFAGQFHFLQIKLFQDAGNPAYHCSLQN